MADDYTGFKTAFSSFVTKRLVTVTVAWAVCMAGQANGLPAASPGFTLSGKVQVDVVQLACNRRDHRRSAHCLPPTARAGPVTTSTPGVHPRARRIVRA